MASWVLRVAARRHPRDWYFIGHRWKGIRYRYSLWNCSCLSFQASNDLLLCCRHLIWFYHWWNYFNVCLQLYMRLPLCPMALRSNLASFQWVDLKLRRAGSTAVWRLWIAKMGMMTQHSFRASPYRWRNMGLTKTSMLQNCQWTWKVWTEFRPKCGF